MNDDISKQESNIDNCKKKSLRRKHRIITSIIILLCILNVLSFTLVMPKPLSKVIIHRAIASQLNKKIEDLTKDDYANIVQWSCHGGDNQQFRLIDAGGGYYNIKSKLSGKCLDVYAGSHDDGASIIQYTCHSGDNQQFGIVDAGGGYSSIVAKHSGKCLDVEYSSQSDGANILQFSCHGGDNQQFISH